MLFITAIRVSGKGGNRNLKQKQKAETEMESRKLERVIRIIDAFTSLWLCSNTFYSIAINLSLHLVFDLMERSCGSKSLAT